MDWNLRSDNNVNALVLTAHPDDETIFCCGMMLAHPSWNWTVVCVTMQLGTPRPQEFETAMNMYKSLGVNISSHMTLSKPDYNQDLTQQDYVDWKNSIIELNIQSSIVLTHNVMGEYGHKHHMAINKMASELFTNVWEFVYPGDKGISPQPRKSKVNELDLGEEVLNTKRQIFDECYKSQSYVWEVLPELMEYELKIGPEIFTSSC